MSDTPVTASPPGIPVLGKNLSLDAMLIHLGTNWQTSLVGVALLALGVAGYIGVPLPSGLHVPPDQLIVWGLGALGLLAAKDSNK